MKFFLLFASLLLCAHQTTAEDDEECARYMDRLFENTLKNHKDKLDPRKLEDKTISYDVDLLWSKIGAEAKLHDGKIEGMSKGKRYGDCTVVQDKDEGKDLLQAIIKFINITLSYKTTISLETSMLGKKSLTLSMKGHHLLATVIVQVAVPKHGGSGILRKVKVDRLSTMRITTSAVEQFFQIVISPLKKVSITAITPEFGKIVTSNLQEALEEEAEKLYYPV